MKFSIIVPVYNAELFLRQCIESVLTQSLQDFELLLVDDGSTDCSAEICDKYVKKDPRIKAYHVENGGASKARNIGLHSAQGEYIIFLDSDDYWDDTDALAQIDACRDKDVILFGCTDLNVNTGQKTISRNGYDLQLFAQKDIDEINHYLFSTKLLPGGPTVFAVRREVIEKNSIRFLEGVQAEDYDFVINVFTHCTSVGAINNPFYIYRRAQKSSVTSNASLKIIDGSVLTIQKWLQQIQTDKRLEPIQADLLNYLAHIFATTVIVTGKMRAPDRKIAIEKIKPYQSVLQYAYWKKTILVKNCIALFGLGFSTVFISKMYKLFRR